MANITLEYKKDLSIVGKGTLFEVEKIIGDGGFALSIGKLIGLYQNIDKAYKKAVGNDGRIIGAERTDILDQIDRFFNGLILIWKKLEETNAVTISIENANANFLFQITERNGVWEAHGKLAHFFVKPVKNFQEIYSNKLAPEIVALLKRYSEAVEDGVIDDIEKMDLKKGMKTVLYYSLFLRMQMEQCFINN